VSEHVADLHTDPGTFPTAPSEAELLERVKANNIRFWVERHFTVERWRGNEADIRCRLHDDRHASASINTEKRVWNCQACGAGGKLSDLAVKLNLDDLPPVADNGQGRRTTYDYTNSKGKLVYQVVRTDTDTGKTFKQRRPDGSGGWIWKGAMNGVKRLPYRLPELQKAIAAAETVLLVEGEKCVEALRAWGYTATCNSEGAETGKKGESKWRPELNQYFSKGAKVYLIADADIAGHEHVQHVGKALLSRGCQVFEIDLGFPFRQKHGKDIADWIPDHSREELEAKIRGAPEFEPAEEEEPEAAETGSVEPVKDYGHAAVLARHFAGHYRWAPHRGSWMRWTGKVWQPEEDEYVAKVAADTLRAEYGAQIADAADKTTLQRLLSLVKETCIYARITGALSFLKGWDDILTRSEEWDQHPWLLNVGNGIKEKDTIKISKHDPARLLTKLAPVNFDPGVKGSMWEAHLERFLPNDNIRRQVQRDLGIALIGTSVEEILPIWYGTGANGKTTTAKVIRRVLGDYVGEAAPGLLLQSRFERHPTELADLAGKRIVFSSEVGQGKRLDEELVKRLTGGDIKKARYMRADFFEFEQTFTIFMIVNHHPVITGTDHAIWRRVRVIPWTVEIPEAERLPQDDIVDRLTAEGPAVLNWLLAGLADWQHDRNWIAPEVRAATSSYRAEQDRLGIFLEEACEEAPHYTIPIGELYEAYTTWCNEVGEDALRKNTFSRRLKERGKTSKRAGHENRHTWFGLRLKRTSDSDLRLNANQFTISPLENESMQEEHRETGRMKSQTENDLEFIDTAALWADELKLRNYLNDGTISIEERKKRQPEYATIVEEISRRENIERSSEVK
jgi:putative DNA primase/helicase